VQIWVGLWCIVVGDVGVVEVWGKGGSGCFWILVLFEVVYLAVRVRGGCVVICVWGGGGGRNFFSWAFAWRDFFSLGEFFI